MVLLVNSCVKEECITWRLKERWKVWQEKASILTVDPHVRLTAVVVEHSRQIAPEVHGARS